MSEKLMMSQSEPSTSSSETSGKMNADQTVNIPHPRVVKFAFCDFSNQRMKGKWSAKCVHCRKYLSDKEGVTTAFTK
jgi:hypothetical protein